MEHLTFQIHCGDRRAFVDLWSAGYSYKAEYKYENNIGRPLTIDSRRELFEWKNQMAPIAPDKYKGIEKNYPLEFEGDKVQRYLRVGKQGDGRAIWNIFYLHCLDPLTWPIYDQHAFRAMKYIKTGKIEEIGTDEGLKYESYLDEYVPLFRDWVKEVGNNDRVVDKAFFQFGRFLKLVNKKRPR